MRNFHFPEIEGFSYGFNIYALQSGRKALLMDAAFRSQALVVKKKLAEEGIELSHIAVTHFHNDHIAGLMTLDPGITVLGSPEYRRTLSKNIPQTVTPVSFKEPFRFGEHVLRFIPAPGHSPCSIFIDIDGEYLHVGDNLMSRYDGKRLLPWVEHEFIQDHIGSLEMLRSMKRNRLILSHGPMIEGEEAVSREIDMRLHYLNCVKNPTGDLTIEEALPDHPDNWVGQEHFRQLMDADSHGS